MWPDRLFVFEPRKCPVGATGHRTAQLHALTGEHVQPRCDGLQRRNRDFWRETDIFMLLLTDFLLSTILSMKFVDASEVVITQAMNFNTK